MPISQKKTKITTLLKPIPVNRTWWSGHRGAAQDNGETFADGQELDPDLCSEMSGGGGRGDLKVYAIERMYDLPTSPSRVPTPTKQRITIQDL